MAVEMIQNTENEIRDRIAQVLEKVVTEMTSPHAGVEVTYASGEKTTTYKVVLAQEFRGKLIGSQGKNITSLRNIVGAMAGNNGFRAIIELVI